MAPDNFCEFSEYIDAGGESRIEVLHELVEVEVRIDGYTEDFRVSVEWKQVVAE